MEYEVVGFANQINAVNLKTLLEYSKYHHLFRQQNYFLLGEDKFLIIKISRLKKPFWGVGKKFIDIFDTLGNYFFIALTPNGSGWFLSKKEILKQISNGSLSYSEKQQQYKINDYNLEESNYFTSPENFLEKLNTYFD